LGLLKKVHKRTETCYLCSEIPLNLDSAADGEDDKEIASDENDVDHTDVDNLDQTLSGTVTSVFLPH
jgi:hypothetical protein